ncbi:MAG: PEP-CTERM sorting domain-containing protein [Aquabacterium sp.]
MDSLFIRAGRLAAFGILVMSAAPALAAPQYAVTDLGALSTGALDYSTAIGINESGWITGVSRIQSGEFRAYVWKPGEGMQDLGTLFPDMRVTVQATGINDKGEVVGWNRPAPTGPAQYEGFKWSPVTGLQDLGVFRPEAINNAGVIVGSGVIDEHGQPGTLPDGFNAMDVSNGGVIVGTFQGRAQIVRHGQLEVLPDLSVEDHVIATGINARGDVVGSGWKEYGGSYGALWRDGQLAVLGVEPGVVAAEPMAINAHGVIVGDVSLDAADPTYSSQLAVLWTSDLSMRTLDSLIDPASGWQLRVAHDINDKGWIVGVGLNPAGQTHAFLLTPVPVPEPGAMLLAALGVGTLLAVRRQKPQVG